MVKHSIDASEGICARKLRIYSTAVEIIYSKDFLCKKGRVSLIHNFGAPSSFLSLVQREHVHYIHRIHLLAFLLLY